MLTAALAIFAIAQQLPENPSFDFSGLPTLIAPQTRVVTHSVTIELAEKSATVTSTTVFRTDSATAVPITVNVPRFRIGDDQSGQPTFKVMATWDKADLALSPASARGSARALGSDKVWEYRSDLVGKASMKAQGTHALRIAYTVPFGRAGHDRKQYIAGYYFTPSSNIGQMNISYRYGGKTVFRLPQVMPDWNWQVGERGAFIRREAYSPDGTLTYVTFYPGGFEDIGGSTGGGR